MIERRLNGRQRAALMRQQRSDFWAMKAENKTYDQWLAEQTPAILQAHNLRTA